MKSRICSVGGNNSFNFLLFKSSFLIVLNMRQRIGEKLLSLQGREMLWLCKLPIHSWSGMGKTLFMWRARSRNPVERRSKINLGKKILSLQLIKLRRHNKGRSRHVSNGDAQTGWKHLGDIGSQWESTQSVCMISEFSLLCWVLWSTSMFWMCFLKCSQSYLKKIPLKYLSLSFFF